MPASSRRRHTTRRATARAGHVAWQWVIASAIASMAGAATAQEPEDACASPSTLEDADVATFADALDDPALCLTVEAFSENGISWRLVTIRNETMPGPLWAVPHDEEDAAFGGAVYAVARYGGVAMVIENNETRLLGALDPNRIFVTSPDAAASCDGDVPFPIYVEAFLAEWDRSSPIIGLHTNWDGYSDGGGLGTISINRMNDKMIPFPSVRGDGRFADEDTIVMFVGTERPDGTDVASERIAWFNDRGRHVIYRHVTPENNDCTLADYLTLNGLGAYINLEVEHGDFETMPGLIDSAMMFLADPIGTAFAAEMGNE